MPRPVKSRRVSSIPKINYFKPAGIPMRELEEINISIEEAEAIRLKDLESLEQEKCAGMMSISRPTFQRVLESARRKLADALLNGKAIRIDGGNFEMANSLFRCNRGHEWSIPFESIVVGRPRCCPTCQTADISPLEAAGAATGRGGRGGCQMRINQLSKNKTEEKTMKIALSMTAPSLDADIEPRFGRCPCFIIVDPETMEFETIENSGAAASGGAGTAAAQLVASQGVKAILTGSCGPNAHQVLSAAGITVISGLSGKAREAIEDYKSGNYQASDQPNASAKSGVNPGTGTGAGMGRGRGGGMGRGRGMGQQRGGSA